MIEYLVRYFNELKSFSFDQERLHSKDYNHTEPSILCTSSCERSTQDYTHNISIACPNECNTDQPQAPRPVNMQDQAGAVKHRPHPLCSFRTNPFRHLGDCKMQYHNNGHLRLTTGARQHPCSFNEPHAPHEHISTCIHQPTHALNPATNVKSSISTADTQPPPSAFLEA
jgi:hypothetical protein